MSSLHEKVAQRRATEPQEPRCVSLQPGSSGLVVCQWCGESWVLPWSQFVGARLRSAAVDAPLELSFANYLVTLTGENLHALLDDLATARLGSVRDLPARYHPRESGSATYISQIEVRSLSETSARQSASNTEKPASRSDTRE